MSCPSWQRTVRMKRSKRAGLSEQFQPTIKQTHCPSSIRNCSTTTFVTGMQSMPTINYAINLYRWSQHGVLLGGQTGYLLSFLPSLKSM